MARKDQTQNTDAPEEEAPQEAKPAEVVLPKVRELKTVSHTSGGRQMVRLHRVRRLVDGEHIPGDHSIHVVPQEIEEHDWEEYKG